MCILHPDLILRKKGRKQVSCYSLLCLHSPCTEEPKGMRKTVPEQCRDERAERQNWRLDFIPGSVCQLELVNIQMLRLQETSFDLGKTLLGIMYEFGLQLIKLLVIKTKALLEDF